MISKIFGIVVLAVCFYGHTAFSFSPGDSLREKYIESYPDRFYVKPVYTIRNLKMVINSRESNLRINYSPNGTDYFGIGVFVFDIGIGVSLKLPQLTDNSFRYGKTEYLDLQTNIYAKQWGADLALQQYDGFYIKDPIPHYSQWDSSDPFPQRKDLTINQIIVNGFYLLNHHKFSYRSAYNQNDRQRKSGGSFIIGFNFLNQQIEADTSLIPGESQQDFAINNFSYANANSIGLSGGYTHTFVKDFIYLNLSLTGGPSFVWSKYNEDDELRHEEQINPLINIRAALGYNSPHWFGGITYVTQQSRLLLPKLDINVEAGNIKLFIGYRFKEVGFLKKDIF